VYQPLDGALETSEFGYSLSIGEQTLTLAGHSHPYKLLPENTIQWSYPPEYSGKIGARHMDEHIALLLASVPQAPPSSCPQVASANG
jgi:hypothetical protein